MENKKEPNTFSKQIADKEKRKLRAKKENKGSALLGLGLFGLVGWTVVVPAFLGTMLGIWLDKRYHQSFSWTLSLMILGVFIGCFAAWDRISKEDKNMNHNEDQDE